MEKRIKLENNDIIIFNIDSSFIHCDTFTISKCYFKNGGLEKTISFCMWDDFAFSAWCSEDEDLKQLDFCFEEFDSLYSHLEKLLGSDDELIIDDDDTCEELKKIMRIYKVDNKINISFENNLKKLDIIEKFHIFIKNILNDYRSKKDCNGENTKIRLINFFRRIQNEFFDTNLKMISEEKVKKKI